eukprot:3938087-Rhodomonas_salina.1
MATHLWGSGERAVAWWAISVRRYLVIVSARGERRCRTMVILASGEQSTAAKASSALVWHFESCSVSVSCVSSGSSWKGVCKRVRKLNAQGIGFAVVFAFLAYLHDVVEVAQVLRVQDALAERVRGREGGSGEVREELELRDEEHRARCRACPAQVQRRRAERERGALHGGEELEEVHVRRVLGRGLWRLAWCAAAVRLPHCSVGVEVYAQDDARLGQREPLDGADDLAGVCAGEHRDEHVVLVVLCGAAQRLGRDQRLRCPCAPGCVRVRVHVVGGGVAGDGCVHHGG